MELRCSFSIQLGCSSPMELGQSGHVELECFGSMMLGCFSPIMLGYSGPMILECFSSGMLWLCRPGMFSGLMDLGCFIPTLGQERGRELCRGDGVALSLNLHFVLLHVHSLPLAALEDEGAKVDEYRRLLAALPPVNRATLKALINHLFRYGIDPLGINLSAVGSLVALGCGRALILSLMSPARKGEEFGVKLCLMPSIVSCMGVEGWGPGRALGRNLDRVSHRVQCFSGENQMNTHNLAIVFGPTLFQTDGKDYKAGRVVEDLISHYVEIFNVGSPLGPSVLTFTGNGQVEGRGGQICCICRHLALETRGERTMPFQTLESGSLEPEWSGQP